MLSPSSSPPPELHPGDRTDSSPANNLITSTLCDPSPNRLNLYLANISSSIPRPQTICANEVDITTAEYYQGQEQTALRVSYVTVTAERSVWIGYGSPCLRDSGLRLTPQANAVDDVHGLPRHDAVLAGRRVVRAPLSGDIGRPECDRWTRPRETRDLLTSGNVLSRAFRKLRFSFASCTSVHVKLSCSSLLPTRLAVETAAEG